MTRFARSKGSNSSQSREPEEATSWAQMKEQMDRAKKKRGEDNPEMEEEQQQEQVDSGRDTDQGQVRRDGQGRAQVGFALMGSHFQESSHEEEAPGEEDEQEAPPPIDSNLERKKRKRNKNKCLNCKEKGHLKMECPKLTEERRKELQVIGNTMRSLVISAKMALMLQELLKMKQERKGMGKGRKKKKKKKSNDGNGISQNKEEEKKTSKKNNRKRFKKDKAGAIVQKGEGLFQVRKGGIQSHFSTYTCIWKAEFVCQFVLSGVPSKS